MLENGKISNLQLTILVTMFLIGSSILLMPSAFATHAKQDAWIAAILGVGIGLLLVMMYYVLGSSFPNMTLAEYSEKILGKWLGRAVSLLFFTFFFLTSALVLRNIGDFLVTYILDETPIQAIEIIFFIVVFMGVHYGLETFSRTSEFFAPWIVLLFLIIIIFVFPEKEPKNITPIFEGGIKPIMRGALPFIGTPCFELVVFLMIFPFINQTKNTKKAFIAGYLIGGILLIIISVLTILVMGPSSTASEIYPSYVLAKKINVANFFERIEAVVAGLWFITIFFKLTICFYASALCLAQTFKLKEFRFLIFPLGMILVVLSLVAYPNSAYFLSVIGSIWTPYSSIYGLFLPVILMVVSKIRKLAKS